MHKQDYLGDSWPFQAHDSMMIKLRYIDIQCIQKLIAYSYPYLH